MVDLPKHIYHMLVGIFARRFQQSVLRKLIVLIYSIARAAGSLV